jgi:hypothetical protein
MHNNRLVAVPYISNGIVGVILPGSSTVLRLKELDGKIQIAQRHIAIQLDKFASSHRSKRSGVQLVITATKERLCGLEEAKKLCLQILAKQSCEDKNGVPREKPAVMPTEAPNSEIEELEEKKEQSSDEELDLDAIIAQAIRDMPQEKREEESPIPMPTVKPVSDEEWQKSCEAMKAWQDSWVNWLPAKRTMAIATASFIGLGAIAAVASRYMRGNVKPLVLTTTGSIIAAGSTLPSSLPAPVSTEGSSIALVKAAQAAYKAAHTFNKFCSRKQFNSIIDGLIYEIKHTGLLISSIVIDKKNHLPIIEIQGIKNNSPCMRII